MNQSGLFRWTKDQFRSAAAAGWFADRKAELLGGIVYTMTTNPPHITATLNLEDLFKNLLPIRAMVHRPGDHDRDGELDANPRHRRGARLSGSLQATAPHSQRCRVDRRGLRYDLRQRPGPEISSLCQATDPRLLDRGPESVAGRNPFKSEPSSLSPLRELHRRGFGAGRDRRPGYRSVPRFETSFLDSGNRSNLSGPARV